MPLDPELQRLANRLTDLFATTETRILEAIADASTSPAARTRLRALLDEVRREMATLTVGAQGWVTADLPLAYAVGATHAAGVLGAGPFSWTQVHREAVQALVETTWTDVAATLRDIEAGTVRAIRTLVDDEVRRQILEGTPNRGELARRIQSETGASTVRYSNGARHAMSDYGDTLARTATATVRNAGEFTLSRAEGVTHMECFDGPDCGLTAHNDPVKANGLVLPIDEAESYPVAHPRCARSWSPRPDIRTATEADGARRFDDDERERLAEAERQRAAQFLVDGRRRGTFAAREPRSARQPRAPRAA